MSTESILIVDDDAIFRNRLQEHLRKDHYSVEVADGAVRGIECLETGSFDLVLTDLRMPGVDGVEFIRRVKKLDADVMCIVLTGYGSPEQSTRALQAGAFWFVEKGDQHMETFSGLIANALEYRRLRSSNRQLQRQLESRYGLESIVGESPALHATLDLVRKIADTDATILVTGESGSGKELIARGIHYSSLRAGRPFVPINCGAIPEELLESELFGHVRGAFTGAIRDRIGRFSAADGGTIFLDEIGDMSRILQTKLLRVLQEREFERVGSSRTERVDVRIIAATNQNLGELIQEKKFREDLFFRLSVVPIEVPPLRARREDIPLLIEHFLRDYAREAPAVKGFTTAAQKRLTEYDWPGNVRQLQGMVQRLMLLKREGWIDEDDLPDLGDPRGPVTPQVAIPPEGIDFSALVKRFESDLIRRALNATGWNKNQAAILLSLKRTTLVEKIRAMGLRRS